MNKPRLRVLSDFLETVPDDKFDINQWRHSCGSVCCAGGWACEIPEFKAAGLMIAIAGEPMFTAPPVHALSSTPIPLTGYHALAAFFGLSHFTTTMLFSPEAYPVLENEDRVLPRQIIQRLFNLIASPCP